MRGIRRAALVAALAAGGSLLALPAGPAQATPPSDTAAAHWTPERMAAATPRDLVVDQRGLGYLRRSDGSLVPHGHAQGQVHVAPAAAPARPTPNAKPPGANDTTPPSVTLVNPAAGATIDGAEVFSATVTDDVAVRSATFYVQRVGGTAQSFSGTASGSTWSVSLTGFTDGTWSWWVVARDTARGGGNATTTAPRSFTVDVSSGGGGGGGGGGDVVTNSEWTAGGAVQTAAGRIYFEMPANRRLSRWDGYVCSGTVATDATTGRSIILTAAHCVYDDVNKAFARNVLFIPDQAGTTGTGTDTSCANDPLGCWTPAYGVVDLDWTTRTFPDNVAWDYAYYVVDDAAGHQPSNPGAVLDTTAGSLGIDFTAPTPGERTHALGYSYSDDPNFMYCAEGLGIESSVNWWLAQCGLSGGASGGPWIQPMGPDGAGPIISVNSWGYTTAPGMAGPLLNGTSASCLFDAARGAALAPPASRGLIPPC